MAKLKREKQLSQNGKTLDWGFNRKQMESASETARRPDPGMRGGLSLFFWSLAALAMLRIGLGLVSVPKEALVPVNLTIAAIFLVLPVIAIFFAANHFWTSKLALWLLIGGFAAQVAFSMLDALVFGGKGVFSAVANGLAQAGLATWCVGMGALLATMVKDKNLLIPIAIFLALYDAFLVLTPIGFTQQLMQNTPVLQAGGAQVPAAQVQATGGKAEVLAYVGPADLVFLGAFFVALFRFRMQTRTTLKWMIPALIVYLAVVLGTGWALPALVPIGLVLLFANWKEFRLTKEEWGSTALVTALGIALLVYGMTRPRPNEPASPAAISPMAASPAPSKSATTPAKVPQDQRPSALPSAPGSTPSPR